MGQTAAPTIARRRQALTNVIGALCLAAALVVSVPVWSGSARAQATNWPRSITIGTASPGGVYDAYGEGLARMLTRTLQIEATAQVTQGPAQNIVLMEKKEAMRGFVIMGVALQGCNRTHTAAQMAAGKLDGVAIASGFPIPALAESQSSAKETIPANIDRNTMLSLHPGALRHYREIGIPVPPGATVGN